MTVGVNVSGQDNWSFTRAWRGVWGLEVFVVEGWMGGGEEGVGSFALEMGWTQVERVSVW